MRVTQPTTGDVITPLLTTQGDLVVRGAAILERLAAGALDHVLTSTGVGSIPSWQASAGGGLTVEMGYFYRDTPGNLLVAGVGFQPIIIFFIGADSVTANYNFTVGFDNGTKRMCVHGYNGASGFDTSITKSMIVKRGVSDWLEGYVSALNADGFTITFNETGSGTMDIRWLAMR